MEIQIDVRNKVAMNADPAKEIVCGNSDYIIQFTFDDEWAEENIKTARFVYEVQGKIRHTDVVFTGCSVTVPKLLNINSVYVGVFAGDLRTTTPAKVYCSRSIVCQAGTPDEPSPDVYAQIIELCNQAIYEQNEVLVVTPIDGPDSNDIGMASHNAFQIRDHVENGGIVVFRLKERLYALHDPFIKLANNSLFVRMAADEYAIQIHRIAVNITGQFTLTTSTYKGVTYAPSNNLSEEEQAQARKNMKAMEYGNVIFEDPSNGYGVVSECECSEKDENGYITALIRFMGSENDELVRLCNISDGIDDLDAATVGQLNKKFKSATLIVEIDTSTNTASHTSDEIFSAIQNGFHVVACYGGEDALLSPSQVCSSFADFYIPSNDNTETILTIDSDGKVYNEEIVYCTSQQFFDEQDYVRENFFRKGQDLDINENDITNVNRVITGGVFLPANGYTEASGQGGYITLSADSDEQGREECLLLDSLSGNPRIVGVGTPIEINDVANKGYVDGNAVLYTKQTPTEEQQAQARANIGINAFIVTLVRGPGRTEASKTPGEILVALKKGFAVFLHDNNYYYPLSNCGESFAYFSAIDETGYFVCYQVHDDGTIESFAHSVVFHSTFDEHIGKIETALDNIIAIQESLIGPIVFTLEGVEYTAIKGMTWAEWCDSKYNTAGCTYEGDEALFTEIGDCIIDATGEYQTPTTVIVGGAVYTGD